MRRLLRDDAGRAAVATLSVIAVLALGAPFVLGDPNHSNFALARGPDGGPPLASWVHPLGADPLHRDELSRLAAGARVSLVVAAVASALATGIGTAIGIGSAALARTAARIADRLVVRVIDALLAIPFLLLVASVGVAVGHASAASVAIVLGISGVGWVARVVRAKAAEIFDRDFVVAARALGATRSRIAITHVLPNVAGTASAVGTNLVAVMILSEAALSYLGVGIPPPTASWGRMLHEAEPYLGTRPLLAAAPAVAILVAMMSFHRLGDALSRALGDAPKAPRGLAAPIELLAVGAVALVVVLLPAPKIAGPISTTPTAATRGGTLHLATYVGVRTLDPALARDEVSVAIGRHVFGRLLTWSTTGEIVPDLAQRFTWSDDGKTVELVLREGVRFHDGALLGAADVKRSFERMLSPKSACPDPSQYAALVGFDDYRSGKAGTLRGIEVLDERTIAFHLSESRSTFLAVLTLSFAAPVCPSTSPVADPRAPDPPCGAGPFRVESFDSGDGVRLVRAENATSERAPYLDAIDWRFNVPTMSQRYRFERGELDVIGELGAPDMGRYATDPRFSSYRAWIPSTKTSGVFLNTEMPPFDKKAVRRAVALALDPDVLAVVRPDIERADRIVPESLPHAIRDGHFRIHDLAAARAAMAEAGYPYDEATGSGGYPEIVDYVTVPDSFEQAAAEVYAEQLAQIGLRVRLKLLPFQAYLAAVSRRGAAAMGWASWGADFPDPTNFFDPMLVSRSIGDVSDNYAFFSNPELDAAIDRAERTRDERERAGLFARAEGIVADEAPWIPTHGARSLEVWQPRVLGYVPNALAPHDFTHVWLAGGGR